MAVLVHIFQVHLEEYRSTNCSLIIKYMVLEGNQFKFVEQTVIDFQ